MPITNIKVISHVSETIEEKNEMIEKALIMVGEFVESEAKLELSVPKPHADGSIRPNVDTGRLRNSITYATKTSHSMGSAPAEVSDYMVKGAVEENEVVIGTNVEYAPFVELGTSKSRPYPYLKPAMANNIPKIKKIITTMLKS